MILIFTAYIKTISMFSKYAKNKFFFTFALLLEPSYLHWCPRLDCLTHKALEKMNNIWWLTTGSQSFNHYMSDLCQTQNFVQIVTYIIKVCNIAWFFVNPHTSSSNEATHFFKMLTSIQKLDKRTKIKTKEIHTLYIHRSCLLTWCTKKWPESWVGEYCEGNKERWKKTLQSQPWNYSHNILRHNILAGTWTDWTSRYSN